VGEPLSPTFFFLLDTTYSLYLNYPMADLSESVQSTTTEAAPPSEQTEQAEQTPTPEEYNSLVSSLPALESQKNALLEKLKTSQGDERTQAIEDYNKANREHYKTSLKLEEARQSIQTQPGVIKFGENGFVELSSDVDRNNNPIIRVGSVWGNPPENMTGHVFTANLSNATQEFKRVIEESQAFPKDVNGTYHVEQRDKTNAVPYKDGFIELKPSTNKEGEEVIEVAFVWGKNLPVLIGQQFKPDLSDAPEEFNIAMHNGPYLLKNENGELDVNTPYHQIPDTEPPSPDPISEVTPAQSPVQDLPKAA
jgi:hypothetical protein